jgi:micrococcal nuclease
MVHNRIALLALCAGISQPALADLSGRVVGVPDGDTLTIRVEGKNVRVRLDAVDAPELGQPYGKSARSSLAQLCRGKDAKVVERGKDDAGRILGSVRCGDVDANMEQVRRGMAWASLRYVPLGVARGRNKREAAENRIVARQGAGPALGMACAQREERRQILGKPREIRRARLACRASRVCAPCRHHYTLLEGSLALSSSDANMSSGTGNTIVEDLSPAICVSVCR